MGNHVPQEIYFQISHQTQINPCLNEEDCKNEFVFPAMKVTSSVEILKETEMMDSYWKKEEPKFVECFGIDGTNLILSLYSNNRTTWSILNIISFQSFIRIQNDYK